MKLKKRFMTMALATVLSLTAILAPISTTYAAGESQDDVKNKLVRFADEVDSQGSNKLDKPKFVHRDTKEKPHSIQSSASSVDYTNPSNYKLITDNLDNIENIVLLVDQYSSFHAIGYYDYDEYYGEVGFLYESSEAYIKSDFISMELYADNNGSLSMVDSGYWDLAGIDEDLLAVPVSPILDDEQYLYIRVGVSDSEYTDYYEDVKLFKIKNPFYNRDDITGHWAESSIRDFMNKGYVGGYVDGTFRPNNSITRAEFVTIFNKTFGLTTKTGKVFSDTRYHWAKNEIDVAVSNGVCNGKSATAFKPNDPITREEAAVMIANYYQLGDPDHDRLNQYSDKGQVASWAKNSVEAMMEYGYMGGYSSGVFKPKGKITRAEAVVTLSRVQQ